MKLGDKLEVVVIYHEKIGEPEPDPEYPGNVKDPETGKIYRLELIAVEK